MFIKQFVCNDIQKRVVSLDFSSARLVETPQVVGEMGPHVHRHLPDSPKGKIWRDGKCEADTPFGLEDVVGLLSPGKPYSSCLVDRAPSPEIYS